MSSTTTKPQVLIIGAGLGGIVLAQSLRKQKIPFQIFERDASTEARFQGWALSLHSWLVNGLVESTNLDLPSLDTVCTTYNVGLTSEGAAYDATSMKEILRVQDTPEARHIRADRAKLRTFLLQDIDVSWGKRFSHYEQSEDGVTALFEDGSSARGDVLVGADGISSRVRAQLVPGAEPRHLPIGVVLGTLTATREQYERWMKIGARSWYIGSAEKRRVFVAAKSVAEDRETAEYYWMLGWHDEAAAKPGYWTAQATKEELHSFVMNHIDGIDSAFTEPIRATPVERMLDPPLQLRDMPPPKLPRGRVTLMGDAVHPMTPFRGEGGNMAMKDGFVLAKTLATEKDKDIQDVLKIYEAEMTGRATESVLASRAAAGM